jgi:hypothetical protein
MSSVATTAFTRYIGIDYSGRDEPTDANSAIQVYETSAHANAVAVRPGVARNWSRATAAAWLIEKMKCSQRLIVGIDHAFSLPGEKIGDFTSWPNFLTAFRKEWRTDEKPVTKAAISQRYPDCAKLLRLTEQWTSSAKSVFDCQGPGVACSTFAGLPWLLRIREQCGDRVFFWPFDGWDPPADKHVVAEVYPSLFRNRYRWSGLEKDALDAFAVAQWLKDTDGNGFLGRYLNPPLTKEQQKTARMEGWILGVA